MADKNMEAQISVEFEEATSRQSLNSGETINTLWGKVKRWLSDLKAICFSGSYIDLSDRPTSLPANGGNANTVNNHTVNSDVPADAVFTDTVYTLPTATADTLGGVMIDGTTITADEQGVISAVGSGGGLEFIGEYYVSSQTTIISKADYKEGDIYLILVRSDSIKDWNYCIYALTALPTSPEIKQLNCVPSVRASTLSVSIRLDSVGLSVSGQGYFKFYKMKVG